MQTVIRQDGTEIELDDAEAQLWIKRGLATAKNVAQPAAKQSWRGKVADAPKSDEGEVS